MPENPMPRDQVVVPRPARRHAALAGLLCLCATLAVAGEPTFRNDVMAVLGKAGCNAGACHGNKSGKGNFKLSLRGEDPDADFLVLTRDLYARRTDPLDPDQSLILLKPTTQAPHEGGLRFRPGSEEYKILRDWIARGMPMDPPNTPALVSVETAPVETVLIEPERQVQITAKARFSDGSERDVTSLAVYETANNIVKISHDGLVEAGQSGETTVLVRYLQQQRAVRLAFVPARPGFKWENPRPNNFIDDEVFAKLRVLRMNPSATCGDAIFMRRAYLDLLGILPAEEEARAFVASDDSGKREKLVDRLLERPEFADFWAQKWADLLRLEEKVLDRKGVQNFYHWIRQAVAENRPLDQFVHDLVAARGSTYLNPPANFYRAMRDPKTRSESTAQLFLGTHLQCAQCHNHPFDRWTQDDYYTWADVFARVDYKVLDNRRPDDLDTHEFVGEQVVYAAREGGVNDPRSGQPVKAPRFLGDRATGVVRDGDRLDQLADWIVKNPLFAKSQVNRIWFNLMGRGIVDPVDDFRPTNPASHPALLDALARDFAEHHYDVRRVIRLVMASKAYQVSGEPNDTNAEDESNYARAIPRRLTAEQMFDAQHEVTETQSEFNGYPRGTRAGQIPGVEALRAKNNSSKDDRFLLLFGKPARQIACECERSTDTTMGQAFQLISGPEVERLLTGAHNRLGRLLDSGLADSAILDDLYWAALTRPPAEKERAGASLYLLQNRDRRAAFEDICWALLNAKEFVFRN
jgi:hypothetical protein